MPNYRDNEDDRAALRDKVQANIDKHNAQQAANRARREADRARRFRDAIRELIKDDIKDEDMVRIYNRLRRMLS